MNGFFSSLPTLGIGGAIGAVLVAVIGGIVKAFKISTDADVALDGLQAKRISELENQMHRDKLECDAKFDAQGRRLDAMNGKMIALAHSNMEMSTVLEKHEPNSPALARARLVLQKAFPIDLDTPADILATARKLGDTA